MLDIINRSIILSPSMPTEKEIISLFLSPPDQDLLVQNGDDAAVFAAERTPSVVSVDSFIEDQDFSLSYCTLTHVGKKSIEASFSDIVAMGARPSHALISLQIPKRLQFEDLQFLRDGFHAALSRLRAHIIGGDLSRASGPLAVTVTAFGKLGAAQRAITRSGARPGDLLFVSGPLGASHAGLLALQNNLAGYELVKTRHREPQCRADLSEFIAAHATSCIDISDGLASEIHHLCTQSSCGALIEEAALPFENETLSLAASRNEHAATYALSGGEDFELLFTISPQHNLERVPGYLIGEMFDAASGIMIMRANGEQSPLTEQGFDHFRNS